MKKFLNVSGLYLSILMIVGFSAFALVAYATVEGPQEVPVEALTEIESQDKLVEIVVGCENADYAKTNEKECGDNNEDNCENSKYAETHGEECGEDNATIHAAKIVCDSEEYLPNWGNGSTDINPETISAFLDKEGIDEHCGKEKWTFEWANPSANNPGDNMSSGGEGWTAFNGEVKVPAGSYVWIREQANPDFIPFTGQNTTEDVSAELYCHTDGLHYDNYDRVDDLEAGQHYYCVAFNVLKEREQEEPLTCEAEVELIKNGGFEAPAVGNNSYSIFPQATVGLEWLVAWVGGNEGTAGLEIQDNVAGAPYAGSQHAELDGDHPVAISQIIPTIVGKTYDLKFAYSARPGRDAADNTIEVWANGTELGADLADDGTANSNTVWGTQTRSFVATSTSTEIKFKDTGTDTSFGGYLDSVSLMCNPDPETPEIVNSCPVPSATVGETTDTTVETVNNAPAGEANLQATLDTYSLNKTTDQKQFQVWDVTSGSTVTINSKFVQKNAGKTSVFGYYTNGSMANFVPVFKSAAVTGYESVPMYTDNTGVFNLTGINATDIGFAIKTFRTNTPDGEFATANSLNTSGSDQVVVYNPSANKYVLGFEDIVGGDKDFNDLIVEVTLSCQTGNSEQETTSSHTTVVKAADLETDAWPAPAATNNSGKWFFYNDQTGSIDGSEGINNSLGSFVVGPAPAVLGAGSAQISVPNEGVLANNVRRNIATYGFKDVKLADIKNLSFSTYSQSAGNGSPASERSAYLNFNVDFDNSDLWQRRLIYLPSANGAVVNDTWQTWDAINSGNALWMYSGPTWPTTVDAGSTPKTWAQILALYPNAETRSTDSWFGFRVGEPYSDGFTGNVDNFSIGIKNGLNTHTETYDFEPTDVIVVDLPECSDGIDNSDDEDSLIDSADPACHSDGNPNDEDDTYTPSVDSEEDSNNDDSTPTRSSTSGSRSNRSQGEVLGAETSVCTWDINTYMRKGYKNNPAQVMILQRDLLNGYMKANVPVDGVYGTKTEEAVKAFQIAKKDKILTPWNLTSPTGIFYKTTLVEAKNTICPEVILPIPTDLINWSENRALVAGVTIEK